MQEVEEEAATVATAMGNSHPGEDFNVTNLASSASMMAVDNEAPGARVNKKDKQVNADAKREERLKKELAKQKKRTRGIACR